MPGLLRGVARTAVVAGTATAVSNNVSRRQANRWAQQSQAQPAYLAPQQTNAQPQQAYAAPAPAATAPAIEQGGSYQAPIEQLKELGELRAQGILTDAEFEAQKA
ncbi:MAG: SHOCT domain-containing protein, partial [Thermoleophilia bacterium]|nr:SHOCT domain-containing protein [Thermoleophilia bacterium]